jgi:predicted esterase
LNAAGHKAPLVLYVQGSGCTPPFLGLGTANRLSTIFSWLPLAQQHRYAVMVVDKPDQPAQPPAGAPGTATACPAAFNAHFSYDSWLKTLGSALRHALTLPEVDREHVLVVGISEGAALAAGLARAVPEVTHVAMIGGSGSNQLFDFAVNAYDGNADDAARVRALRELDAAVDAINANPHSGDKFFAGHAYLRWSSFFAQSPAENLVQSRARVYLASGMRDRNTPILSTEVAYARLRALGRDVTFRRVPDGDHGLMPAGGGWDDIQKEYDAIFAWFDKR